MSSPTAGSRSPGRPGRAPAGGSFPGAVAPGDFTDQADAYVRARPGYPAALLERLAVRAGVGAGDPVADLGAGTGISTRALAALGFRVVAVEPNQRMRAAGRAEATPRVDWVDGTFEATGLGSASVSWAVAAQAFHWADPERALPEIHRILRPRGCLTVLWNDRDVGASELLERTRRAILRRAPGFEEAYRDRDWGEVLVAGGWFDEPESDVEHHVVPMDRERYLDLWRSHNRLAAAAGRDGVRALVEEIAGWWEGDEAAAIPYVCRAFTVRRTERP